MRCIGVCQSGAAEAISAHRLLSATRNEYHFEFKGKRCIERWFRIPEGVYQGLLSSRTDSPFVLAVFNEQLRTFQARRANLITALRAEFSPVRFGNWFYKQIKDWSESNPKGLAFVHVFRKTTLQHARRGEDISRQIANDASVSESVLKTNYVKETDEESRQRSNRTYQRILFSLTPEVAVRYGYVYDARSEMESQLRSAIDAKDWAVVNEISKRLAQEPPSGA